MVCRRPSGRWRAVNWGRRVGGGREGRRVATGPGRTGGGKRDIHRGLEMRARRLRARFKFYTER